MRYKLTTTKKLLLDIRLMLALIMAMCTMTVANAAWNTWLIAGNVPEMQSFFEFGVIYGGFFVMSIIAAGALATSAVIRLTEKGKKNLLTTDPNKEYMT